MMTLRQYRKQSRKTVKDISGYMQVSARTIYLWESGERPLTAKTLYKLMAYYGADAKISEIAVLIPLAHKGRDAHAD